MNAPEERKRHIEEAATRRTRAPQFEIRETKRDTAVCTTCNAPMPEGTLGLFITFVAWKRMPGAHLCMACVYKLYPMLRDRIG